MTAKETYANKAEQLHFLEFVAVLAGLMGIVVQTSTELYFPASLKTYFTTYLLLFILYAVIAYARILGGHKRRVQDGRDVAILFGVLMSTLLAAVFTPGFQIPQLGEGVSFAVIWFILFLVVFYAMVGLANHVFPRGAEQAKRTPPREV
jgi:hypothetical protein